MIVRVRNLTLSFVIFVIFLTGNLFKTAYFAISEITKSPPPPYTPYFTLVLMPVYPLADACFASF